jgi:hypothetical protein
VNIVATMKNLSGKALRCLIVNPIQAAMGRQGMEVEA